MQHFSDSQLGRNFRPVYGIDVNPSLWGIWVTTDLFAIPFCKANNSWETPHVTLNWLEYSLPLWISGREASSRLTGSRYCARNYRLQEQNHNVSFHLGINAINRREIHKSADLTTPHIMYINFRRYLGKEKCGTVIVIIRRHFHGVSCRNCFVMYRMGRLIVAGICLNELQILHFIN